jgi:hypothetical protein
MKSQFLPKTAYIFYILGQPDNEISGRKLVFSSCWYNYQLRFTRFAVIRIVRDTTGMNSLYKNTKSVSSFS